METHNVYREVDSRNDIDRQIDVVTDRVSGSVLVVISTERFYATIKFSNEQYLSFVNELVKIKNIIG